MSPEQISASGDIDGRSDLYSLGCVLFEMLAGTPPFVGSMESVTRQHLMADPPPITSRRAAVPPQVAAAIMRALSKTPADRFNPAAQFADALRPMGRSSSSASAPATVGASLSTSPAGAAGVFLLVSGLVLAIIYLLVLQVGLPMWVFATAMGLLVVGLPIIVGAAAAERKRSANARRGLLSWRNAIWGGGAAFGALALLSGGWVASRALGIGPAASLVSTGAMASRERVILADFENRGGDSTQVVTVTELLRIGLSRSASISVVAPDQVGRILEMMQRDLADGLPPEVAMEAAVRDGIKGVITGEVIPVGSGVTINARLVSTQGAVLLEETESVRGEDDLVAGVDRLTAKLREHFGESLRSIRADEPLDRVTTGSMKALRVFSLGLKALDQGDATRAMTLMDEAIAADSSFAMAYRKLAVILRNASEQRARSVVAATKAYEHRDHLTDRERYLVIAAYHMIVTGNVDEQIANYRNVLDRYPDDTYSLTNMGVIYSQLRDFPRAAEFAQRAIAVDSTQPNNYENLVETLGRMSMFDSADAVARHFERRFPTNPEVKLSYLINEAMRKDYDSAAVLTEGLLADQRGTVYWEAIAYEWWGHLDALRGQLHSARNRWAQAFRLTEARGLEGTYLERTARRALAERMLLDDPAVGRRLLDEALARYPLESLTPLDRPYGFLAMAYAAAGETSRAQALIDEYLAHRGGRSRPGGRALGPGRPRRHRARRRTGPTTRSSRSASSMTATRARRAPRPGWPGRTSRPRTRTRCACSTSDSSACRPPTYGTTTPTSRMRTSDSGELYEERGDAEKALDAYDHLQRLLHAADPELQPLRVSAEQAMARLRSDPTQED